MPVRRRHDLTRYRFLRVLREVRRLCPAEHATVIDFTVGEARDLLDHGEDGIGLEVLVSNLHEVAFPVPALLVAELRWLAGRLRIDPRYAALLDQIHAEPGVAPDRRPRKRSRGA